jgi:hypothetical protein
MPRSNRRPQNREARRWRIKLKDYPFTPVTAYPFGKADAKGRQFQSHGLTVTMVGGTSRKPVAQ